MGRAHQSRRRVRRTAPRPKPTLVFNGWPAASGRSVPLRQSHASDQIPLYCGPSRRQVALVQGIESTAQTAVRFDLVGHRLSGPVSIRTTESSERLLRLGIGSRRLFVAGRYW